MLPLSTLLFGQPLTQREDEQAIMHLGWSLDRVLKGVLDLLQHDTGDTEAFRQAKREWEIVLASDYDYAGIAARRAALLFALAREPELAARFGDDGLARGRLGLGGPFFGPPLLLRQRDLVGQGGPRARSGRLPCACREPDRHGGGRCGRVERLERPRP